MKWGKVVNAESVDNTPCRNKILSLIQSGEAEWIAEALTEWISEEDCKRFCEIYEINNEE